MRVEKDFIILFSQSNWVFQHCKWTILTYIGWHSLKEQCLIKSTLKTHHFTSTHHLTLNNITIITKPRLNCSILTSKWELNHSNKAPCFISYFLAADILIRDIHFSDHLCLNFLKIHYFIIFFNYRINLFPRHFRIFSRHTKVPRHRVWWPLIYISKKFNVSWRSIK